MQLVTGIYRQALARDPEEDEIDAAIKILGESPTREDVEDLLWAVMLLPEFQLVF